MLEDSKAEASNDVSSSQSENSKSIWSFVAMHYYALILNRTFRVWVTDKYVCGIHEGNTIASPTSTVGAEWQKPQNYINLHLERKYKDINLESDEFLSLDKANFRIPRSDIIRIDYHPKKWGMGRVPYSGRLVLVTNTSGKIELILLGKQDATTISRRLLPKREKDVSIIF